MPDKLAIMAVWLVMVGAVLRELLGQTEIASFGIISLHTVDPGLVLATVAALANLSRWKFGWQPYTVPIFAMAALISINFLRGLAADPTNALVVGRMDASIAALLLLAVTLRPIPHVKRAARKALITAAAFLGLLTILRLATHPTLFMTAVISDDLVNDGGRALSAQGSFILVLASAMLTSDFLRRRFVFDGLTLSVFVLPLLILLTRQGTVNVSAVFALGAVILLQRSRARAGRLVLMSIAVVSLGALLTILIPTLLGSEYALQREANWGTRQAVWSSLLEFWSNQPTITQLIGIPTGQRPPLFVLWSDGYRQWERSIHSMYYGALPIMGYAGLLAYFAMLATLLSGTVRKALHKIDPLPAFPTAFCIATAILSVSYELHHGSLIGLFISICWLRAHPALPKRVQRQKITQTHDKLHI